MGIMNQNGQSSFLMVMITAVITLLTAQLVQNKFLENVNLKTRVLSKQNLELYFQNVQTDLMNNEVWKKIISENRDQFQCLFTASCVDNDQELKIVLRDLDGKVIADGDEVGFDKNGNACDYEESYCLYKMRVSWKPECTDINCLNPKVRLIPVLEAKTGEKIQGMISFNLNLIAGNLQANRETNDIIDEIKSEYGGDYNPEDDSNSKGEEE